MRGYLLSLQKYLSTSFVLLGALNVYITTEISNLSKNPELCGISSLFEVKHFTEKGKFSVSEPCITIEGLACHFPFIFNDVTYTKCTFDYLPNNAKLPWCSTHTIDGKHIGGNRSTCNQRCPVQNTLSHDLSTSEKNMPRVAYNTLLKDIFKKVNKVISIIVNSFTMIQTNLRC